MCKIVYELDKLCFCWAVFSKSVGPFYTRRDQRLSKRRSNHWATIAHKRNTVSNVESQVFTPNITWLVHERLRANVEFFDSIWFIWQNRRVGWGKQPPLSENGYIETHNVRMGVFALANYYFIPKLCFPKRILSSDITNSFVHHLKKCIQKGVLPHTWGKTPFCVG